MGVKNRAPVTWADGDGPGGWTLASARPQPAAVPQPGRLGPADCDFTMRGLFKMKNTAFREAAFSSECPESSSVGRVLGGFLVELEFFPFARFLRSARVAY